MRTTERTDSAAYLALGFGHLWVLVIQWGFARFPANMASYVALGAALMLVLVAGPLALVTRRPAAILALVALAADMCAAGLVVVQPDGPRGLRLLLLLLALVPVAIVSVIAIGAIRHPSAADGTSSSGATSASSKRPFVAAVCVIVYTAFFVVFNGGALLAMLLGLR